MWNLLSRADLAVGRLDGSTKTLPNPELFVFRYVRREAVLSSPIEGTQASLMDVLEFEAQAAESGHPEDVAEVLNYVAAIGDDDVWDLTATLREPDDADRQYADQQKAGRRDLPIGFADHEISVTLIPLSPALRIWIRGHVSAFGDPRIVRARAVDFVFVGVGGTADCVPLVCQREASRRSRRLSVCARFDRSIAFSHGDRAPHI
jgi:hypothetical protein